MLLFSCEVVTLFSSEVVMLVSSEEVVKFSFVVGVSSFEHEVNVKSIKAKVRYFIHLKKVVGVIIVTPFIIICATQQSL